MITTTLNKLVYELLEQRRGDLKDTDPITVRLVVDWIQSRRAQILKRQFAKPMRVVDDNLVQDLGVISMGQVESNDINPTVSTGEYMWRSTIEIPKTIDGDDGTGTFTRIGPASKLHHDFKQLPYDKALHFGNGKFNKHAVCAFVLGDYLYLHSKSGFHFNYKYINVRGVFQDPITAARITNPSWSYDDDYPINKSTIDDLKEAIVKVKFPTTIAQPEDRIDDSEDNIETPDVKLQKR
jgi:hypothetical protein